MDIGAVWDLIILQPVLNCLIVLYSVLFNNFGLTIIALTIIINVLTYPLTVKQTRATKAMQAIQPKVAELQKKFGKDRQKMAQEQMRLYKESGVKPAGCAITMIIQFPVWIALYQSIMLALAVAPEGLLNLAHYLYPWPVVYEALPLSQNFMGMNLAAPNFILAILVGASMWLQQKMSMTTLPTDPRQRQQTQMMQWMMPMLFAFLALNFPAGLSLYWVATSIVRIFIQYRVTGWGGLSRAVGGSTGVETPDKDKKYVQFAAREEEREEEPVEKPVAPPVKKSVGDVGADIVISDDEVKGRDRGLGYPERPSKSRYLPGRDRAPRHRKK